MGVTDFQFVSFVSPQEGQILECSLINSIRSTIPKVKTTEDLHPPAVFTCCVQFVKKHLGGGEGGFVAGWGVLFMQVNIAFFNRPFNYTYCVA